MSDSARARGKVRQDRVLQNFRRNHYLVRDHEGRSVMGSRSGSATAGQIERTLCGLIRQEGTVTFSSLANMCPQYRWVSLFKALHNLEKQRLVKLTPLPWDYEISALRQTAAAKASP